MSVAQQLPLPLLEKQLEVLKEVNLYLGSHGNKALLDTMVKPPSLFVMILITLGLLVAAFIISEMANYYEIIQNWDEYRCKPSIAPFSKFYGYDLNENLNFCISQSVKEHAPGVINPIYSGISQVSNTIDGVYGKVVAIEGGVTGLLSGFQTFVVNFMNSFGLIGTRIRMSLIRIKDIFSRVHGIFIAFVFAGISTLTFGANLVCNPLVSFIGIIAGFDTCCFAPDTPIAMADGSIKTIAAVRIGDHLASGDEVTSTYLFEGAGVPMIRIHGIHVSENHYLIGPEGTMIQAGAHPAAIKAPCLNRLWCLGTSNNRISVMSSEGRIMEFADYEESEEDAVITEVQAVAETLLNGPDRVGPPVLDYSLGVDPTILVLLKHSVWKPMTDIQIGDELINGAVVTGLVEEVCEDQCETPDHFYVSAAQLIQRGDDWIRAAHIWPRVARTSVMAQLMVTENKPIVVGNSKHSFLIRDYSEISHPAMQAPYDKKLTSDFADKRG